MKLVIFAVIVAATMLIAPAFADTLRRLPSSNDDFAL